MPPSTWFKEIAMAGCLYLGTLYCYAQDSTSAHPVITGHTQIEHIENNSEHNWFSRNYSGYSYDSSAVSSLKKADSGYTFVVVGGTWCPDTHKELPKFYKVIDDGGIPRDKVKLFFVDRELKSPDMASKKYKIKRLPTFIVFKGDKEEGRIVEHPEKSIEQDLVKIIQ
jgi:thiol-disulfide isomerase/thioredoxin